MSPALAIALSAAVPLWVERFRRAGGPSDDDRERARSFAGTLGEKGDVLLFGGRKGEAAELFNRTAEAIAVLSFQPGGVRVFGEHWEAEPAQEKGAARPLF